MNGFKRFLKTTLVGGFLVVLPIGIVVYVFNWVFDLLLDSVAPLVALVLGEEARNDIVAGLLAILIILCTCFLIGLFVKTSFGRWLHSGVEGRLLSRAPGYTVVKETLLQFMGSKRSPFSSVALVQIYENDTMVTAFVTDEHDNGLCTVFVPTGPNPTSGNIYHVKSELVHPLDVPVDQAMRSIISCGAGSAPLIFALKKSKSGAE